MNKIKSFLFENKTAKQTIVKNTFWLFFGNIISRLIRAAILIYAARVIGATEFGAFNYALSIAAFFTIFADFGINAVITREAASDKSKQEKYFSTALALKIFMGLLIGIILVVVYPLLAPHITSSQADANLVAMLVPLMILVVLFDTLRDFGASLCRAWEKMEIESFIQIFTNVIIVIAGFIAINNVASGKSLALGYIIGTGLGMIVAFIPFRRFIKNPFKNFSFSFVKEIFKSSWVFGMMGLVGAIMLNTDSVMIGWLSNIEDVGYYSAGQRIVQLIYIIPALIATAFFPSLAKSYQDKERFSYLSKQEIYALILLAAPLSLGGIILSKSIISLLYGAEYLPGVTAFLLMNLTYLPAFIATVFGNAIFAIRKEKILLKYVILSTLGNALFNIIFIPQWGIAGAALSTVINQIIGLCYLYFSLSKEINIFPKFNWSKPLFSLIAMGIAVYLLDLMGVNIIINILLGGLIYVSMLTLFKEEFTWKIIESVRNLSVPKDENINSNN
ncbi:MAG: flippase [Candidatus Paceibacterota bacterium]|jgi:O-antigen/teichoic acid export membrane protein